MMMMKTVVYHGDNLLGEVEIYPQNNNINDSYDLFKTMKEKGIRISKFSQQSERCPPLAVLHAIASSGVWFKLMESSSSYQSHLQLQSSSSSLETPLLALHSTCFRDSKTAVVSLGDEELHLVAMPSRNDGTTTCFWAFKVARELYNSCLVMLNLRCLGIVFDLDETLIVANTSRSFEDRIDNLQRKISTEVDPKRISGMMAELKRYQEDKAILKQYADNDQVIENGKLIRVQSEVVPALSDNHQSVVRPLIRLQDKSIVLTRINPLIRDTSVLVRLRPAWEELRSYLTAKGRKRFEVYVCTMAERDYALEMWRLLDPDSSLISTNELLDRIVCVKPGTRKSLLNVFHDGICHPKMALVIDDRLTVWDDKDQPRVHVVPAFAPYYAPQAEANNAIPVLCVARNVACNVRGGFFKEFDDGFLQRISEVFYEDDLKEVPSPPDVSNFLASEDETSGPNGNKDPLPFDGMAGAEVERRLKEAVAASAVPSAATSLASVNLDPRLVSSLQFTISAASVAAPPPAPQASSIPFSINQPQATPVVRPLSHVGSIDPSLQGSPAREEGEVPESELDPDTRRRLLILQHGQDTREHPPSDPPYPIRSPVQAPSQAPGQATVPVPIPVSVSVAVPRVQSRGSWFSADDQMNHGQLSRVVGKEFSLASDNVHIEKQRPPPPPFPRNMERADRNFIPKQRFPREAPRREERAWSNHSLPGYQSFQGEEISVGRSYSSTKDIESNFGRQSSNNKDFENEPDQIPFGNRNYETAHGRGVPFSETPVGALHDIAMKCRTQVEFMPGLVSSRELIFSMQVDFAGQKVGEAMGKTRKEAQDQAAKDALRNLAEKYLSYKKSDSNNAVGGTKRTIETNENSYFGDSYSHENQPSVSEESMPLSGAAEPTKSRDFSPDGSIKSTSSVYVLKELCTMEGLSIDYKGQPLSANSNEEGEIFMQVEIDGQVLGKGAGSTWEDAKMQAAERALASLRPMLGQFSQKHHPGSPRPIQPSKRLRSEIAQILRRTQSARYPKNASPVP